MDKVLPWLWFLIVATPESQQYWADLGAGIGATAYSPEMELEADRAAVYILLYAGYRPEAMQDFLVRATRESARQANLGIYTVSFLQTPSEHQQQNGPFGFGNSGC